MIVFQMGKVGSSSLAASFPTPGHPVVVQVHRLGVDEVEEAIAGERAAGRPVRRHHARGRVAARYVADGRPHKVITPVREPIGRAISYLFQAFEVYVGVPVRRSTHSVAELRDIFLAQQKQLLRHRWFERASMLSMAAR